jgi:hypothetical protein
MIKVDYCISLQKWLSSNPTLLETVMISRKNNTDSTSICEREKVGA